MNLIDTYRKHESDILFIVSLIAITLIIIGLIGLL